MTTTTTTGKGPIDKWATRTVESYVELTDDEEIMLTARAAKEGLTLEEYFRVCCGFEP